MADVSVTIKLNPREYRLLREELEIHKDLTLRGGMKNPDLDRPTRDGIRQRHVEVSSLLERL